MDDCFPDCQGCKSEAEGYHCPRCHAPLCGSCATEDEGLCTRCLLDAPEEEAFTDDDLAGNLE